MRSKWARPAAGCPRRWPRFQLNTRTGRSVALENLGVVAGFAVWAMVATLIVILIFRIFSFYITQIQEQLR